MCLRIKYYVLLVRVFVLYAVDNKNVFIFGLVQLGSCLPNSSRSWAVNKWTRLKNKLFDDYVVHVNDHPPIKLDYFLSSKS